MKNVQPGRRIVWSNQKHVQSVAPCEPVEVRSDSFYPETRYGK